MILTKAIPRNLIQTLEHQNLEEVKEKNDAPAKHDAKDDEKTKSAEAIAKQSEKTKSADAIGGCSRREAARRGGV